MSDETLLKASRLLPSRERRILPLQEPVDHEIRPSTKSTSHFLSLALPLSPHPLPFFLLQQDKVAAAAAAAAILISGTSPALAADKGAGEGVFSANCAACHAGGNNVVQAEKTLRKDALVQYLTGGFKEASIVTQVTNGKGGMPSFGGRLSDDEIANVAAYVYATADADAWE